MAPSRKKILFMIGNLESGGVSKGMVNLLHAFDRERYEVSLWLGSQGGLYRDMLPEGVRTISDERNRRCLQGIRGLLPLLRHGNLLLFMMSLLRLATACISKASAGWLLSRQLQPLHEEFDAIIDYNGQHQLYFMVDKLQARKKITFFHSDYSKWSYYQQTDARYFPKTDAICSISPHCVKVLQECFPSCAAKIHLVEIISNPSLIHQMAEGGAPEMRRFSPPELRLLTVGHVCPAKGSDLALEAAALLQLRGIPFQWFFIGSLDNPGHYAEKVQQLGLEKRIHFLGLRQNPYPYMKEADIIVHPSQFEGKSIALDEAKILCKPIVVTNFSTVHDQFEDGVNASICEMSPESLASAIEDLSRSSYKQQGYSSYLKANMADNSCEVEKLYQLIEA